jgi:hypothetical protein
MRAFRRVLLTISVGVLLCALCAYGQDQDAPSLGAAARQARLQKQHQGTQAKDLKPGNAQPTDAQSTASPSPASQNPTSTSPGNQAKDGQSAPVASKDAASSDSGSKTAAAVKSHRVITNDEIPEQASAGQPSGYRNQSPSYAMPSSAGVEGAAAQWKQVIQGQKNAIASMQSQITSLSDSIKFAPGNCVSGCVQWNERQKQKQEQVEAMKSQLEEMQKQLEAAQEACRQQGFGSSVYDP